MDTPKQPYWFAAKRYGWGWGLPLTWQGWVVMATWMILFGAITPLLMTHHSVWMYVFVPVMIGSLMAICYAKGEPPRWRWG